MTTSAITDSAGLSTYNPSLVSAKGDATMDQADFLTLLTTQLQTQDPFEPVDSSQMVTQMATITQTSAMSEMNESMSTIKELLSGSRVGELASWIGRAALVESNIAAPNSAGEYAGQITLGADASNVNVDLVDGDGNVVKTIELGAQSAGSVNFYWDGTDADGNNIGTQALQVKVRGVTPTQTATWTTVVAVQSPSDASDATLITALGNLKPSEALQLS